MPEPKVLFERALTLPQEDNEGSPPHSSLALKLSITNCQVLVILALQQLRVAEYSRGAVLCALAAAIAIELSLRRASKSTDSNDILSFPIVMPCSVIVGIVHCSL